MEATAFKPAESLREGGFCIEIQPGELIVTRDRSAWNPRMRTSRVWQMVAAVIVAILVIVELASEKSISGPVPPVSFPFLLAILLFFFWPLGVNNICCTSDHMQVIRLRRGNETGRWLFPRSMVERIHIDSTFGRPDMGFEIVFTVQGNAIRTLRGIQLNEAQIVLLELKELGFDVRGGTPLCSKSDSVEG